MLIAFLVHQAHLVHHGVRVSDVQSLSAHLKRNYRSHAQEYPQTPGNPSAISSECCNPHQDLGTTTNAKLFVVEIILDCIQFKLFVMLLCHNEILLQYDTSIVSLIVYLEFSHFDLHYLYSSTNRQTNAPYIEKVNEY